MEASADVVVLVRGMLTLARAACTGVLTISARGKNCKLAVSQGRAYAARAPGASELLGDLLLSNGEFDARAHAVALALGPGDAHAPIGEWLLSCGVASRSAIDCALQHQLRARVSKALGWHGLTHDFAAGSADIGLPWLREPVDLSDLAWSLAQQGAGTKHLDAWLLTNPAKRMVVSAFGSALLRREAWFAHHEQLVALLRGGASVEALVEACRGCQATLRQLAALVWLAAVVPAADSGRSYAMLLRKHAQLRRRASAAELLDVARDAQGAEIRRALRRLSREVHPDALGPFAPSELREASGELMRALVQAERELRLRPIRARS